MNPLKVKASTTPITSASFSGLEPLTNAEVQNYIANVITTKFATDTTGSGTAEINITTDNSGSGTSIGTFSDTDRTEATGTHPATGAVDTVTYYAKQVTTAVAESVTARPIAWSDGVRQMTDSDLDGVLDTVISAFVAESTYTAGQYKLQATAPSGGTWQARYTITDVANGGNTTTYLWQKTAATTSPSDFLAPLKSNDANSVKIMTAAEIEQLVPNFRNRIIDTNIGTYKLQASAPASGTWVELGSSTTDTREEVSTLNYVGNYTGNYSGTYGGPSYTGSFTSPSYSGNFSGNYVGTTPYSGTYTGTGPSYSGNFTGPGYTSPYTGVSYSAEVSYTGPSYTGLELVAYTGNYSGGPFYSTTGGTYTGNYLGSFSGTASYTGPTYTGPSTPGTTYTGNFAGGPFYSTPAGPSYSNPVGPSYGQTYTGNYSGPSTPGTPYTGFYSGPGLSYSSNFSGNYTTPVGPAYGQTYTGFFNGFVAGPSYSGTYSSSGTPYSAIFTSPVYSGTYTGNFSGSGNYTGNYVGSATYTGNYTGNFTSTYTNIYGGNFTGNYSGTYAGTYSGATIVSSKETVSTIKLWIRTA